MFSTGQRATRIVNRAIKHGLSLPEIAVDLGCGVDAIYRWRRNPEQRVNTRLTRSLNQLKERVS